jgi:predicted anti-sigma-YlaC factor YlaD
MNECAGWEERLGQGGPDVEAHVAGCGGCRALKARIESIAAMADPPLPPGAWERIERALAGSRRRRVGWMAAAAAAALVAVPGTLWLTAGPRSIELEVVDVGDAPDPGAWAALLTQHAENDAVVQVAPPLEEESP